MPVFVNVPVFVDASIVDQQQEEKREEKINTAIAVVNPVIKE